MGYDRDAYLGPPVGMKWTEDGYPEMSQAERSRWEARFGDMFKTSPRYGSFPPFVGYGWQPLVWEFLEQAEEICREHGVLFRVHQFKEKFAGLRLYHGISYTDEGEKAWENDELPESRVEAMAKASALIRELEKKTEALAAGTCERCGSTEEVKVRGGGWLMRLCDVCAEAEGRE